MSLLEIIGFGFGIVGVWLTINKNTWCFPVGIVNVVITAWLVYSNQLYADCLQQTVYLVLLIYGWIAWSSGKNEVEKVITYLPKKMLIILLIILAGSSALLGYLLETYTNAAYPYADSTGTVICFIAQWMVAVKKLENWYLWIVANVMYVVIYILKDMPLYGLLSFIYFLMAIIGLLEWKKIMTRQKI